jgi:hypothetical protein
MRKPMQRKSNVAHVRRQIVALERDLAELARRAPPDRALKLGRASDLLTEARACDLYRLR